MENEHWDTNNEENRWEAALQKNGGIGEGPLGPTHENIQGKRNLTHHKIIAIYNGQNGESEPQNTMSGKPF